MVWPIRRGWNEIAIGPGGRLTLESGSTLNVNAGAAFSVDGVTIAEPAALINLADYDAGAPAVAIIDFNTGAAEAACSVTINGVIYLEADIAVPANGVWTNGATAANSATSFAAAVNGDTRATAIPATAVVSPATHSVMLIWDAAGVAGNVAISTTSAARITVENAHGGLDSARRAIYAVTYVVTAQDVLNTAICIPVPFQPRAVIENAKTAARLAIAHTGLVTVAAAPNRIMIDNTAGATHLAATDVVNLVILG